MGFICAICRKPAEMIYAVQPGKEKPICGKCFRTWAPPELDRLLGVKQPPPAPAAVADH